MYHMTGFYSFPHPISQILDKAPRSRGYTQQYSPQVGIYVVYGTSIYQWFLVKKSRRGYSSPKWTHIMHKSMIFPEIFRGGALWTKVAVWSNTGIILNTLYTSVNLIFFSSFEHTIVGIFQKNHHSRVISKTCNFPKRNLPYWSFQWGYIAGQFYFYDLFSLKTVYYIGNLKLI